MSRGHVEIIYHSFHSPLMTGSTACQCCDWIDWRLSIIQGSSASESMLSVLLEILIYQSKKKQLKAWSSNAPLLCRAAWQKLRSRLHSFWERVASESKAPGARPVQDPETAVGTVTKMQFLSLFQVHWTCVMLAFNEMRVCNQALMIPSSQPLIHSVF